MQSANRAGLIIARHAMVLALSAVLASWCAADETEAKLKLFNIKYAYDSEGTIVAVELPPGARDFHIEAIVEIPTITEVRAPKYRGSFKSLKYLAELPRLSGVGLEGAENANDCVAFLKDIPNLKRLWLAGSALTNHGLNDVCTELPRLVELDVTQTQIDSLGLAPLAKHQNLETLRLGFVRPGVFPPGATPEEQAEGKRGFRYIASMPRLKRVNVVGLDIRNDDLMALAYNCQLEEIKIEDGDLDALKVDAESLIYLQSCQPSLHLGPLIAKSIVGSPNVRGEEWISALNRCTESQLQRIPKALLTKVARLTIHEATNVELLKWLPCIRELQLHNPTIDAKDLAGIREARTLETIAFSFAKIDSEMVKALDHVRWLRFSHCEIDDAAMMLLEAHPRRGRATIRP